MINSSLVEGAQPLAALLASAVTFAALTGLGRLPGRLLDRVAGDSGLLRLPISLATGWAIAAVISAAGAPFGADQSLIARAILGLGLAALIPWGARRAGLACEDIRLLRDLALVLVLAMPLAWLAARTPAVMYDEFAQWLLNTRYLVQHNAYWLYPDWIGVTDKPGYPNGSTVIALLASQIAGPLIEAYFKTFVVFATASLGFVLAFAAGGGIATGLPRLIGLAVFVALANPFFDPRIALSAYTDAPTGFLLALAGATAAAAIGAVRGGRGAAARAWFVRAGAGGAALTMLRSTNVVLVGALTLACMALTIGSGRRRQGLWLGLLIGPSAAGWIIWKIYLHVARIRPDLTFRPVATWDWWAPVTVLRALFINRLRDHPGIGGTALSIALAVICLCPVLWRRLPREGTLRLVPPRALLAIIAVVCGCFAAFLAAAYMGFFSPEEVAQAGSIWRYLTELGPLLLAGAAAVVGALAPPWRMPARNALAGVVGTLTVMATLALPVIACGHYALDCRYPDVIASRLVTAELARPLADFAPNAGKQRRLAIIHPTMGDWMAHAAAYDLGWPVISRSIRYRTNGDGRSAQQWAWDVGADALLDLTALDRSTLTETGIIPSVALRARPPGRDAPWTTVAATVPRPLPRCGGR